MRPQPSMTEAELAEWEERVKTNTLFPPIPVAKTNKCSKCGIGCSLKAKICQPCYDSRGTSAEHGTTARYVSGCRCLPCCEARRLADRISYRKTHPDARSNRSVLPVSEPQRDMAS